MLRVPEDRLEAVKKRLPNAEFVTEPELGERLAIAEKEAVRKALEKKEAAAAARKIAREKKRAEQPGYVPKPVAKAPAKPLKPAKAAAAKKPAKKAAPPKKKPAPAKSKLAKKKQPKKK